MIGSVLIFVLGLFLSLIFIGIGYALSEFLFSIATAGAGILGVWMGGLLRIPHSDTPESNVFFSLAIFGAFISRIALGIWATGALFSAVLGPIGFIETVLGYSGAVWVYAAIGTVACAFIVGLTTGVSKILDKPGEVITN